MDKKTLNMLMSAWNDALRRDYKCQIYGIVTPRKHGEFTLTCYALKETKRYGIQITEVNRSWSDRPYYQSKNIWKNVWGSTMVEFDERRNRPQEEYGWYGGKWGAKISWDDGDGWFMQYVKYLNLNALQETKYKFCAFDRYCKSRTVRNPLSLVQYCKLLNKHKEVEFLAKAGLSEYIERNFLDRLSKSKSLRDFFRSHCKELMETQKVYRPQTIIRAHANGWSLEETELRERARYSLKNAPKGIDRLKLMNYLLKNKIDIYDYYGYCRDVGLAKMDILAFGMTFPKDFHAKRIEIQNKIKLAQKKADEERMRELKKLAQRVNKLIEKMRNKLAWRVGDYSIIVPTTRKEFTEEGNAMRNCIGGYFERCADGDTVCFFIRKNGERLADVEMSPSGTIRQCRLIENKEADKETKDFATIMAKKIATQIKRKAA